MTPKEIYKHNQKMKRMYERHIQPSLINMMLFGTSQLIVDKKGNIRYNPFSDVIKIRM